MKLKVDNLVEQGLVKKKTYTEGKYKGLSVLKYTRKVFYNNLWSLDDRLLECRGTVVDEDDNVIVLPFKKVFNLHENGTEVDPERKVVVPDKINGFLGCATMTDKYGLIISTTGSLGSDHVELAQKWILKGRHIESMYKECTYLFEICDKTDPHIIKEEEGAYLIGLRHHDKEKHLSSETFLDLLARFHGFRRPVVGETSFKNITETKREGYIVRDTVTGEVLCKLKSKHYLSKKALQRVGKDKVNKMWSKPQEFKKQLDEEFYGVLDSILNTFTKEEYMSFTEQDRRKWIEDYFNEK